MEAHALFRKRICRAFDENWHRTVDSIINTQYDYSEASDTRSDSSVPQLGLHLLQTSRWNLKKKSKELILFKNFRLQHLGYIPEECNILRNNAKWGIFHYKNSEKYSKYWLTKVCLAFNFIKWPTWRTIILFHDTFITVLYMFRATSYSSSGGKTVLIQHLLSSLSLSGRPVHRTATYREWRF